MKARITNQTTLDVFAFWHLLRDGSSLPPVPERRQDILFRKGLGRAIRKHSVTPGAPFTVSGSTDVLNEAAAQTMLAALQSSQQNTEKFEYEIQNKDLTWKSWDDYSLQFVIASGEGEEPSIRFMTYRREKIINGFAAASKIQVDLSMTLIPVEL